jgi:hypothetical protein
MNNEFKWQKEKKKKENLFEAKKNRRWVPEFVVRKVQLRHINPNLLHHFRRELLQIPPRQRDMLLHGFGLGQKKNKKKKK